MTRAAVALGLLAVGCAPCVDIVDVPIDASEAPDPSAWEDAIADTLARFHRWTGGDVCLSAVTVGLPRSVERQGHPFGGAYGAGRRDLWVSPDNPLSSLDGVVVHELCHAWDDHQGFPSRDHPALFPPDALPRVYDATGAYDNDKVAMAEVFALTCDSGPAEEGLLEALSDAGCEVGLTGGDRWVQSQVFVDQDPSRMPLQGSLSVAVEQRRIDDVAPNRLYDAVFADGQVWLLTLEHAPAQFAVTQVPLDGGPALEHRPLFASSPLPWVDLVGGERAGRLLAQFPSGLLAWSLRADGVSPVADTAGGLGTPSVVVGDERWLLGPDALTPVGDHGRALPLPEPLAQLAQAHVARAPDGWRITGTAAGWPRAALLEDAGGVRWSETPSWRPSAAWPDGTVVGLASLGALDLPRPERAGWSRPDGAFVYGVRPGAAGWWLGGCGEVQGSAEDVLAAGAWAGAVWLLLDDGEALELVSLRPGG